jgi:hypothetical protein
MTSLAETAQTRYAAAYDAAIQIGLKTIPLLVEFEIYAEDATHGGQQVGTGRVAFHTICYPNSLYALGHIAQTAETRQAFKSTRLENLRCRMTIQLFGLESPFEHCFESGAPKTTIAGDIVTHTFIITDTLTDNLTPRCWDLDVFADTRTPLVLRRFGWSLGDHPELWRALKTEMAEALVDRTLRALPPPTDEVQSPKRARHE